MTLSSCCCFFKGKAVNLWPLRRIAIAMKAYTQAASDWIQFIF